MNILIEIDFPSGTRYYAMQNQNVGNVQYIAAIMQGVGISEVMGFDGTYEVPVKTVTIIDTEGELRKRRVVQGEVWAGIEARIYDQGHNLINTTLVDSWQFEDGQISFKLTDKTPLKKPFTKTFKSETAWQYQAPGSLDQPIPQVYNTYAGIKAWAYDHRPSFQKWMLGTRPISSITELRVNGIPVNNSYWTLQNNGTYWWVNLSHGVLVGSVAGFPEFIHVDVTTPTYTPLEMITSLLSGIVTVETNAAFAAWIAARGYNSTNCHFYLDRHISPAQLLQIFHDSFGNTWRKNANDQIIFDFIDRANIVVQRKLVDGHEGGDLPGGAKYGSDHDPTGIKNIINYNFNRDPENNKYTGYDTYTGPDRPNGDFPVDVTLEFLTEAIQSAKTAQEIYELHREPVAPITISTTWDIGKDIFPGAKVQVQHRGLKTPNPIFGAVLRRRVTPPNIIEFDILDLNFLRPEFYWSTENYIPISTEDGRLIEVE